MKFHLILLLFFFANLLTANRIDAQKLQEIHCLQQIDSLLKIYPKQIGRFKIYPKIISNHLEFTKYRQRIFDSLQLQSCYNIKSAKLIPNSLLINGFNYINASSLFCYYNTDKKITFDLLGSTNTFQYIMNFSRPINRFGKNGIEVFNFYYSSLQEKRDSIFTQKLEKKFLTYKFNGLVEYNRRPNNQNFDTIQLEYSGIYNHRSYFIRIYKNHRMDFQNYDMKAEDTIRNQRLNGKEYRTIVSILNYASYVRDTTFDAGFVDSYWMQTNLSFTNGKKVSIYDRGMEKSFVMRRLYETIDRIKTKYFTSKSNR